MRFKSPSGYDVVAGRSSTENDRVTWGVARDWDLWFHARGIGGSHVVLLAPPTAQVFKALKALLRLLRRY
jgi:predicted ribosome quality control (RQC) complex YloA/Tae2 family protein